MIKILKNDNKNGTLTFKVSFEKIASWKKILEEAKMILGKNLKIKGFRQGQIPKELLDRYINNFDVLNKASEIAQSSIRKEILKNNQELFKTHRISQNKVTKISQDDFQIVLEWEKMPSLKHEIKNYKKVKISFPQIKISSKDIDVEMEKFRKTFATFKDLDKSIALKDFILMKVDAFFKNEKIVPLTKEEMRYEVGSFLFSKAFDDALLELKVNQTKKIIITLPKDFYLPELSEKEVSFTIKIIKVQARILADINDALIEKLKLNDVKNTKQFREKIIGVLKRKIINKNASKILDVLWKKILETNEFDLPEKYIETEKKRMLARFNLFLSERNLTLKTYLEKVKLDKTSWEKQNNLRLLEILKKQLCVFDIATKEKIDVLPNEIEEYYNYIAKRQNLDIKEVKKRYQEINLYNGLLLSKIESFLLNDIIDFNKIIIFEA